MRIVVHGQQAFGKAVLEALLERGDDVVAVYAPPEGARPDPLAAAAAAAGLPLVRPASFRDPAVVEGFRALRAGPPGHGVRHADRAGGVPRRADARHHPVPPVAPAAPPRAAAQSTGRSSRARPRPASPCSGRTAASTPATCCCSRRTPIAETDTLGSVYFDRLFPMGVEAMLEAVDLVRRGTAPRIPQDEALATYEAPCEREQRAHRLGQAVPAAPRPRPRLRPGAGGLDHLRRPGPAGLRGGAAARPRRRGPRRRDGRGRGRSATTGSAWSAPTAACGDARAAAGGAKTGAGEWAAASGLVPGARLE